MDIMRRHYLLVFTTAVLFLLTCYEPLDPSAPKDMEMNVLLVSSCDNTGILFTYDTAQTIALRRQFRLKIIMSGSSQFDSFSVVVRSDFDSIKEILPFRYFWTDTVWTQFFTVLDTMKRTITVTGFANGAPYIKKRCVVQTYVLFITSSIDTVFDENIPCSIGLKATGISDDSLDFYISSLFELRKIFNNTSLSITRDGKDTATLNFSPLGNPGNYIIPIVVAGGQKVWTDTFYLKAKVEYVDLKPVIDSIIGDTIVKEGEPLALEIYFSNYDGDTSLSILCDQKLTNAVMTTSIEGHRGKSKLVMNTNSGDASTGTISFVVADNGHLTDTKKINYNIIKNTTRIPIVVLPGMGGMITAVYPTFNGTDSIASRDTLDINFSDSVAFSIKPETGYHIEDIVVDGLSKGKLTNYHFADVRAPHEFRAEFALNQYNFTLFSEGHGTVNPPITAKIDHGTQLEITAVADEGYSFLKWKSSGNVMPADPFAARTTVTVTSDSAKISALFAINSTLSNIIISSGKGGSVELNTQPDSTELKRRFISVDTTINIDLSDSAIFTIKPDYGYHIVDVIVDGLSKGQITNYRFMDIRPSHELRAEFELNQYTFSIGSDGHGTVTPPITTKIDHGTVVEIAAAAEDGYRFVMWRTSTNAAILKDSSAAQTTVTIKGDSAKVTACFARNTLLPVINIIAESGGYCKLVSPVDSLGIPKKIISKNSFTLNFSDSAVITIHPDTGYHIVDVIVDGLSQGRVGQYRFIDVHTVHELRAEFALNQYTFFLCSDGHGTVTPPITTKIDHGTLLDIAAVADKNYHFDRWNISGMAILTDSMAARTTVIVKTDSARVTAKFKLDPAMITLQPVSKNVFEGDTVVFSVLASGHDVKYQWLKGNQPVTGAVSSTYTAVAALSDNGVSFSCIAYNTQNADTSDVATLMVKRYSVPPSGIEIINGSAQLCAGNAATLRVTGGMLYNGASWKWYSAACGGSYIKSGDTITVVPQATTTYFVRAEGPGDTTRCAAITIIVSSISISPTTVFANPSTVCPGVPSILSFSGGSLGTGAQWKWYEGVCGNGTSSATAATGKSITVLPSQTTTYFVRAEGQCSTTVCKEKTVKIYTFTPKKLTDTSDTIIIGDTARLLLTSPSTLVPVNDWKWFVNNFTGKASDSTPSIYDFPRSATIYYVHDMGDGKCDTTFYDTVFVDSLTPFACYPFNSSGIFNGYLCNVSKTSRYTSYLQLNSNVIFPASGDTVAKFDGAQYLQTPRFPFFPGNDFTVSLWLRSDTSKTQYLFWTGSSGIRLDPLTNDSMSLTSFFNGDSSISAKKIARNQWCFVIYKVTQTTSGVYQVETWRDTVGTQKVAKLSTFTSTKQFDRSNNLYFGTNIIPPTPGSGGFFGKLDKIKIYAYPITEEKMKSDFDKGRFGNN